MWRPQRHWQRARREGSPAAAATIKMFLVKQTIVEYRTFPRHSKSAGILGILELFREIYLSDHIVQTPATQRFRIVNGDFFGFFTGLKFGLEYKKIFQYSACGIFRKTPRLLGKYSGIYSGIFMNIARGKWNIPEYIPEYFWNIPEYFCRAPRGPKYSGRFFEV